ncbi:MAG: four helix bundle protein [Caldiserica bacterium]|nr:MAG: four helix bundle protein [Caldisericota bacterium]
MFGFERLNLWKKSMSFVEEIYKISKSFPKEETFGVKMQIRRASISIVLNIAEGSGRKSKKEFSHFLTMAYGSLCEVISLLKICLTQKYISNKVYIKLYEKGEEIAKMLSGTKSKIFHSQLSTLNSKYKTSISQLSTLNSKLK